MSSAVTEVTYSATLASRPGTAAWSIGTMPSAFSGATAATGSGGVKVSSDVAGGGSVGSVAVIVVPLCFWPASAYRRACGGRPLPLGDVLLEHSTHARTDVEIRLLGQVREGDAYRPRGVLEASARKEYHAVFIGQAEHRVER